jgi:hypothetical protein
MAKGQRFDFTNYDGGLPSHPIPERGGSLSIKPTGDWGLAFAGRFGRGRWIYGWVSRYQFTIDETSSSSCRVTLREIQDESISASFELPSTPAGTLRDAIASVEKRVEEGLATRERIEGGEWWIAPNAFRGLGLSQRLSILETHYLGGWSGHAKTYTGKLTKALVFDKKGVSLSGISTIFTIPWSDVRDVEVEGPESASKRVTVGRALALGVFALAAKKAQKSAVVIVQLKSGEEAIFQTEKFTAGEMRAKLVPITTQLKKVAAATPNLESAPAPIAGSVADELKKLAELRAEGVLTDEEFATQKAKLLGP